MPRVTELELINENGSNAIDDTKENDSILRMNPYKRAGDGRDASLTDRIPNLQAKKFLPQQKILSSIDNLNAEKQLSDHNSNAIDQSATGVGRQMSPFNDIDTKIQPTKTVAISDFPWDSPNSTSLRRSTSDMSHLHWSEPSEEDWTSASDTGLCIDHHESNEDPTASDTDSIPMIDLTSENED